MNLNQIVRQFFDENEYHKLADKIVIIRGDGIAIYSNFEDYLEAQTVGALVSGVWQAAESLSSLLNKNESFLDFRLGFDTSADGLYILPFTILEKTYYIGAIYGDADNPGKLKRNMRLLKDNVEVYLSKFSLDPEKNREEYLFENISDEEMDKLFAFGGI